MSVNSLITDLSRQDVRLWMQDDQLHFDGPDEALTDGVLEKLRRNKADLCHLLDLKQAAGPDWDSIAENPAALAAWTNLRHAMQLRDRGEVPAHWTKEFDCPRCGTVPVETSWPDVDHCPWCHNRLAGRPMPKSFERCS